jgi:uncharacterized membrane protein YqjE
MSADAPDATIAALVKQTADDLSRLVGDHLKLARLELADDARRLGARVALVAGAAALLAVGYGCGAVALALFLSRWLGDAGAFGAVAGGHALAGLIALLVVARRARAAPHPLEESRLALERSRALLMPEKTP